jgi:fructose-1,6-bisphosphatase/inositol monophosphatase family enzyme
MPVFATGLMTDEETYPLHGRMVAVPRDLDPVDGTYELVEGDLGAAVVFTVYHQGEPVELGGYRVLLLAEGVAGSPFELHAAPLTEPVADPARGEARWAVPAAVTAETGVFRAQVAVVEADRLSRAGNVLRFRVRPRVGD